MIILQTNKYTICTLGLNYVLLLSKLGQWHWLDLDSDREVFKGYKLKTYLFDPLMIEVCESLK